MRSGALSKSVDGMAGAEAGRDSLLNVVFIYTVLGGSFSWSHVNYRS